MAKALTYTEDSVFRLTEHEERLLFEQLSSFGDNRWLEQFIELPIYVDDGYNIHITGGSKGPRSVVGRDLLFEDHSLKLLKEGKSKGSLRGLYFPSATPSRPLINLATFYFDEFYVIHPGRAVLTGTNSILDEIDRYRKYEYYAKSRSYPEDYLERLTTFVKGLSDFNKDVRVLKHESILHTIPPQMQKHPQFVELLTADLGDPKFEDLARDENDTPVFMAATKLEPLLPRIGEELHDRSLILSELKWNAMLEKLSQLPVNSNETSVKAILEELDRELRENSNEISVEAIRQELSYRAGNLSSRSQGLFDSSYGVKEVEPVLAASVLLNHAFLTAEEYGLIPITDNQRSKLLLNRKLERVSEQAKFVDYKREVDIKASTLALRVLEDYLPVFAFESFEQVLEARHRLQEQLIAFRQAMAFFAAEIDESPYEPSFQRKIEHVLVSRVRPALEALKTEIQKSCDAFISRFLKNAQTGSIPIVALMFAGLPASAVIALSAGVITMEAAITTYREIKRTKRNGLSLLLG